MKEYIEAERKIIDKKIIKITCDKCEKTIPFKKVGQLVHGYDYRYYEITTQHHHWGNDSHESIKHHQYCSTKCFMPFIEEYFNDKYSGKIDLEIETIDNINYYDWEDE